MPEKDPLESLLRVFVEVEKESLPELQADWNDLRHRLTRAEFSQVDIHSNSLFELSWKLIPLSFGFSCLCLYLNWVLEEPLALQLAGTLSAYPQFLGLIIGVG